MAMMDEVDVTDNPPKNDDLRIQQTQGVRDWTARFQPSYWIFVGSRSEMTWSYDKWEINDPNGNW